MDKTQLPRPEVLVLGTTGRIGQLLARVWQDGTAAGLIPYWQGRQAGNLPAGGLVFDPLADPDALTAACRGKTAVLVLAGVTPKTAPTPEQYRANTDLALAVLRAVARCPETERPRVLLTSTSAVYGGAGGPFSEESMARPENAYGVAKREMEQAVQARAPDGVEACILRIANVAGADQLLGPGPRAVTLHVFEDGTGPVRNYMGPRALARILETLVCHPARLPDCLNLAVPGGVDMRDLLAAAGWSFEPVAAPATLAPRIELDVSRLEALMPLPVLDAEAVVADWQSVTGGAAL